MPPPGATYTARGGTIAYMAPEQFVTGQSSVQSDIFALGLILYELATGRHPFHRPDAPEFQIHPRHPVRRPARPSARSPPSSPSSSKSVILRCLEKQPSARFASAADVREGLKTIMRAMQLDSVVLPGDSMARSSLAGPPRPRRLPKKRSAPPASSPCSPSASASPAATAAGNQNTIVVLPFINFGPAQRRSRSTATPSPTPSPPASPACPPSSSARPAPS